MSSIGNEYKELIFSVTKKDIEITYFSGKGAGGQYRNKHQNCCRIKHKETGIIVTGQSQRSKEQNTKEAFRNLANNSKFKIWLKLKTSQMMMIKIEEKTIPELVDDAMNEKYLKIEYLENL